MRILVIDGQGGKMGRAIVEAVAARLPHAKLRAVGTNSVATQAMLKGGASQAATGQNAIITCCRDADAVIGPVGIVIANSMMGEITAAAAAAVGSCRALKILIPVNRCNTLIAGVDGASMSALIQDAVEKLAAADGVDSDERIW